MNGKETSNGGDVPCASVLVCTVCRRQMRNPHMLPCLHAFCLACLQDECSQKSRDKFFCPVCVNPLELTLSESTSNGGNSQSTAASRSSNTDISKEGKKSVSSRPWHSFDKILENEAVHDALQRRLAELPASESAANADVEEDDDDEDEDGYYGDEDGGRGSRGGSGRLSGMMSARLDPPALFPCTNHSDRLSDQFCTKCEQVACSKCITSFHRRCSQGSIQNIKRAVESKRRGFDSLHNSIAGSLALCEDAQAMQSARASVVETARSRILDAIRAAREQMVAALLAKEKSLTAEVNRLMDLAKADAEQKAGTAERLAVSLGRQLDVMSFSIGAGAEGELLPYLPRLEAHARADASLATGTLQEASQPEVLFQLDDVLEKVLETSPMGFLKVKQNERDEFHRNLNGKSEGEGEGGGRRLSLTLTLMTSFHGGARDDISEPLLTDLVLLANGDVILTDRDNQCVKKFNRSGKLLTRVMLDASPSRIAVVSHGRAVVSTTGRRELYFLSLQGTVRILSSVRVKKLYTFLTSLGGGMLAAGTNYGDCLDLITEEGCYVKTISSSKPERAGISRPFYITPVQPLFQQGIQNSYQNHSPASGPNVMTEVTEITGSSPVLNQTQTVPDDKIKHVGNGDKTVKRNNEKNASGNSGSKLSSNYNSSTNSRKSSLTTSTASYTRTKNTSNGKTRNSPSSNQSSSPSSSLPSSSSAVTLAASASSESVTTTTPASSDAYSTSDLWVTDSARKILFRLRQADGKSTFTLKTRSDLQLTLECPLGVTVHPSGLSLLADRDTDSVLLLDKEGSYIRPVLTSADGLARPCAIYAGHRGHVALSQVDGMVKIYSSTLQYV